MEITKREIIISVAIAAVMLIVGFFISGKITDKQKGLLYEGICIFI